MLAISTSGVPGSDQMIHSGGATKGSSLDVHEHRFRIVVLRA
jgi:hypothetical protein